MSEALTARSLIAEAQAVLRAGEYEISSDMAAARSLGDLCFLGEDAFGVVLVVSYESWSALRDGWTDGQAVLVKILTEKLARGNPKAWEGYLVLLTASQSGDERAEDEIRYDTSRVRKVVGTGESIRYIDDLTDVLMPLLPLSSAQVEGAKDSASVLGRLSGMLVERDIRPAVASAVVRAFKSDEPLMESISGALKT
jgi:hypothetical protein